MNKILMPEKLTAENGAKALLSGEFCEREEIDCPECLAEGKDEGCETCNGSGKVIIEIPISWTTIKEIYKRAVEYLGEPIPIPKR